MTELHSGIDGDKIKTSAGGAARIAGLAGLLLLGRPRRSSASCRVLVG